MTEDRVAEKVAGQIQHIGYARVPSSIIRDTFPAENEQAVMTSVERFAKEHGWRVAPVPDGTSGVVVFYPESVPSQEGLLEQVRTEEGSPEAPQDEIAKGRKMIEELPDDYVAAVAAVVEATRALDGARDKCAALQKESLEAASAKSQAERKLQEALENMKRAAHDGDEGLAAMTDLAETLSEGRSGNS